MAKATPITLKPPIAAKGTATGNVRKKEESGEEEEDGEEEEEEVVLKAGGNS